LENNLVNTMLDFFYCPQVNDSMFYVGFGTIWPSHLGRSFSNHS
jgi:hypothetical protein